MAQVWSNYLPILCIVSTSLAIISNTSDDQLDVRITLPVGPTAGSPESDKCLVQLHSTLEKLRKRQATSKVASLIDLSGYALHQALRNAPVDMYVTNIKVRAPSVGSWVQVQRCQFSRNAEMKTQLLFNDLLVSGEVRLLPGDLPFRGPQGPPSFEHCSMTLRLRRAGLDLRAAPQISGVVPKITDRGGGIQVRTESNFVEPHFLSVHAYGCKLEQWARDGWFDFPPSRSGPVVPIENRSQRSSLLDQDHSAEIRIISLGQEPELQDDGDNEVYRQRIMSYTTQKEKLAAVLSFKNQMTQQANAVFQAHGPFSQQSTVTPLQRPLFTSHQDLPKPGVAVSTITELDENLRPIRPSSQQPFHTHWQQTTALPSLPLYGPSSPLNDVSSEMEDVFLRGAKALLAKYMEKQLEVPLKEALMTKIGYTVSYGRK